MVSVTLLGTAQDGGVPQGSLFHPVQSCNIPLPFLTIPLPVGCFLPCCSRTQTKQRFPVALGLTDSNGRHHLFEASRHMGMDIGELHDSKYKGRGET